MRVERVVFSQEKTDLQFGVAPAGPDPDLVALFQAMLAHEFFRHRDGVRRTEPALNIHRAGVEVRRIKSAERRVAENVDAEDLEIIAGKIAQRNKTMDQRRCPGNAWRSRHLWKHHFRQLPRRRRNFELSLSR